MVDQQIRGGIQWNIVVELQRFSELFMAPWGGCAHLPTCLGWWVFRLVRQARQMAILLDPFTY